MAALRTALIALVIGAAATTVATTAAHAVASGHGLRAQGPGRRRRLQAQRFRQLRALQAGRWLRFGLFPAGLEARRLHLRPQAQRDSRRRQVGHRAGRVRALARGRVPGAAARALRPGVSAAQLHRRGCRQAHAIPVRGVPHDARRGQAAGRLSLRDLVEQQVHQIPHDHAQRPRHRSHGAKAHSGLDPGAVESQRTRRADGRTAGEAAAPPCAAAGAAAACPAGYICR